ncbi:MAG: amidohydrolase family protein, partial [Spirochaetales bacterium]|nr:amidohydrolase family protein [Spirochaetales bacterium]
LERFIVIDKRPEDQRRFWGIKLYPPLGYNPWPEDPDEREKVEAIYEFCSTHRIPIITHCDDQGFRGISAKEAWSYTAPSAYKPVLERHPTLTIDFAHYGWQYNQLQKSALAMISGLATGTPDSPWFHELVELMNLYPNVYGDVSFCGCDPAFYVQLANYIKSLEHDEERETVLSRTLFGSDFSVNLIKVESYVSYYRIFEKSPFGTEEIDRFVSVNPMRFLGLGD